MIVQRYQIVLSILRTRKFSVLKRIGNQNDGFVLVFIGHVTGIKKICIKMFSESDPKTQMGI